MTNCTWLIIKLNTILLNKSILLYNILPNLLKKIKFIIILINLVYTNYNIPMSV